MSLFVLMSHALLHCLWYLLSIALRPQGAVPANIQCSWLQPRLLFRDAAVSWKGNSNEVTEMDFMYLCLKLSFSFVGEGITQFYSLASLSLWKTPEGSKPGTSWALLVRLRACYSVALRTGALLTAQTGSTSFFLGVTRLCSGGWLLFTQSCASQALKGIFVASNAWVKIAFSLVRRSQQCLHPSHSSFPPLCWSVSAENTVHPMRKWNRISPGASFWGRGFLCFGLFQARVPRLSKPCCVHRCTATGIGAQGFPARWQSCCKVCPRADTLEKLGP